MTQTPYGGGTWMSVVLLAVMAVATSPACSEQEDLFAMSLEDLMAVEIDTVVSASKYEQKVSDAPSSVTIITADEIRKYGYRTLAEVLRSAPGFYVNNDRNYEYVGVRGFRRPGDYDTRILLLVDGHRTNENIGNSPLFGVQFVLDVDLIDRVEIIRGPGSSLYGSNALLAVINVITKGGKTLNGLELSGEVAGFDTWKSRITYGNRFDNGLDLLVSATRGDSEGHELYFKEFDDNAKNDDSRPPILIGILGTDPFADAFEPLKDKEVRNRPVVIRRFKGLDEFADAEGRLPARHPQSEQIGDCHVVFICRSEKEHLTAILGPLRRQSLLTVADTPGFLEAGGIVDFLIEDKKVCFEINTAAAQRAGLQIRSQLLRLAKRIVQTDAFEGPNDEENGNDT
ncbi:MAG: YfiR/HmsC family protein [Planctomycetota bacterium]|nr:YfiR/HmsC family protein [Planctomycetota bacterium]